MHHMHLTGLKLGCRDSLVHFGLVIEWSLSCIVGIGLLMYRMDEVRRLRGFPALSMKAISCRMASHLCDRFDCTDSIEHYVQGASCSGNRAGMFSRSSGLGGKGGSARCDEGVEF